MNNTITLSQLITRLAKSTGVDNNTARRFLRAFFGTVEETLEAGQSISLRGIGIFRRSEADPETGRSTVAFIPDASFLEELNRPFEMFEAVELADGVDFNEVEEPEQEANVPDNQNAEPTEVASTIEPEEDKNVVEETVVVSEPEPVVVMEETAPVFFGEPQPVKEPAKEPEKPAPVRPSIDRPAQAAAGRPRIVEHDPVVVPPHGTVPASDDEDVAAVPPRRHSHTAVRSSDQKRPSRLWLWTALIIGVAAILGYFAAVWAVPMPDAGYYDEDESDTPATTVVADAIEEVTVEDISPSQAAETAPAAAVEPAAEPVVEQLAPKKAEPVYDTVQISLIKLAKKHYGVGDYWVFIFDANRDKIKNPNAIRPGTRVLIPDKADLPGASPDETRSIAKKKSAEYLAKY